MGETGRPIRYVTETRLLNEAIDGDARAANSVLLYLGSHNPDLRQIMQDTIHDASSPRLWQHFARCLALHCWGEILNYSDPEAHAVAERIDQSIADIFILDENRPEHQAKQAALCDLLGDPDPLLKRSAAYLLALRGDAEVVPILEDMIINDDEAWQLRSIRALAGLKDARAGRALVLALSLDRGARHNAAARALTDLGEAARPALVEALDHASPHVRWHAARCLAQQGDPAGVEMLAEGLHDESDIVRRATSRLLAYLDAAAVPAILRQLTRHPLTATFKDAAYHALHGMTRHHTQERVRPVLEALSGPAAAVEGPDKAQRLLTQWTDQ